MLKNKCQINFLISTIKNQEIYNKMWNINYLIVSNCQKGHIESFWAYYNLIEFSDTECNENSNKQKEENMKLLINRDMLNYNQTCHIGNARNDYKASLKNNIEFMVQTWIWRIFKL